MKKKITIKELKSIIKEEVEKFNKRTLLENEKKTLLKEVDEERYYDNYEENYSSESEHDSYSPEERENIAKEYGNLKNEIESARVKIESAENVKELIYAIFSIRFFDMAKTSETEDHVLPIHSRINTNNSGYEEEYKHLMKYFNKSVRGDVKKAKKSYLDFIDEAEKGVNRTLDAVAGMYILLYNIVGDTLYYNIVTSTEANKWGYENYMKRMLGNNFETYFGEHSVHFHFEGPDTKRSLITNLGSIKSNYNIKKTIEVKYRPDWIKIEKLAQIEYEAQREEMIADKQSDFDSSKDRLLKLNTNIKEEIIFKLSSIISEGTKNITRRSTIIKGN